jgi:predicted methyltransferase
MIRQPRSRCTGVLLYIGESDRLTLKFRKPGARP